GRGDQGDRAGAPRGDGGAAQDGRRPAGVRHRRGHHGIVVTMQAIDGPVEEIGHKVGAALVGTFLGILLSYGFFTPMAGRMEFLGAEETVFCRTISTAVAALAEGASPKGVVARARQVVPTDCRPSQAELRQIYGGAEG